MIALDVRTLTFTAMLIIAVMSAAMYVVWRSREEPALRYWIASGFSLTIGFLLIALRGQVPLMLSVPVANAVIAFAAGCAWAGIDAFLGRRPNWPLILALTGLLFAAFWYFAVVSPDTNIRIMIISAATGFYALASAWRLMADPAAAELGPARRFTAAAFLLHGAYTVFRFITAMLAAPIGDFMAAGTIQALVMIDAIMIVTAQTFGFFAMVEQRHLAQLVRARDLADQANAAKSDFLANMSHELRTPLNAVIGFAELMAREAHGPMPAKYREYANDVRVSGTHLMALINDVLDLAKIDAGRFDLHEAEFDSAESARRAVVMTSGLARANEVTVEVVAPPGLPPLFGDQLRLEQVLVNIISNAVKFSPRSKVSVALSLAGGDLVLRVTDTGIGMTEDEIRTALTRFGQVNYVRLTKTTEGSGLGLPMAAALVQRHGGSLAVDSRPGAGTTVTIRLPGERLQRRSAAA